MANAPNANAPTARGTQGIGADSGSADCEHSKILGVRHRNLPTQLPFRRMSKEVRLSSTASVDRAAGPKRDRHNLSTMAQRRLFAQPQVHRALRRSASDSMVRCKNSREVAP